MDLISDGPVPLYGWDVFDRAQVAITSRIGGVSDGSFTSLNLGLHVGDDPAHVLENRERAASAFGVNLDAWVVAEQIAGTGVHRVTAADRGRGARRRDTAIPDTDALVTTEPDITLAMMAADCMLITLVDEAAGILATVHAGWPGATNGIIGKTIDIMRGLGAGTITAAIGPAVPGDRYQVGPEVAGAARAILGADTDRALHPDGTGRYLFDLVTAATIQLARAGVAAIHPAQQVTGPDTPFYSHRFEGPTGRFALLARLAW